MDSLQVRFSVLGGASVAGQSGADILKDLQSICSNISRSKLLKVSVHLDNWTKSGGFLNEISDLTKQTQNIKLRFGIDTAYLDAEMKRYFSTYKSPASAVRAPQGLYTEAKKELETILRLQTELKTKTMSSDLRNAKNAELSLHRQTYGSIMLQIKGLDDQVRSQNIINDLIQTGIALRAKYNTVGVTNTERSANSLFIDAKKEYDAILSLNQRLSNGSLDGNTRALLESELTLRKDNLSVIYSQAQALEDGAAKQQLINNLLSLGRESILKLSDTSFKNMDYSALYKDAASFMSKYGKIIEQRSGAAYGKLLGYVNGFKNNNYGAPPDKARADWNAYKASVIDSGYHLETLGMKAKRVFSEKLGYGLMAAAAMMVRRAMRAMVNDVKEVDAAMTELKKVTDETDATYERFLTNAAKRAKTVGTTISDIVEASSNFARLGYGIEDASTLADVATIYKNVGDGVEDIDQASESIISTMKAFGIQTEDAMLIVDKFNTVGNNFAITSGGAGDALAKSASALASANNSVDESLALITAANTVVQNPEIVGTSMKTVSMYLRAAKTEAEEAGESTEGMANSVSELRDELLSLTGGKVDIQIDEDNFKSTYQILQELSKVWGDLTDVSQANILEMIGGKRNSNVIAAILTNFEIAESVMEKAGSAAGSALTENEKYLSSIDGHITKFKATFEEFSTTLLDSKGVKTIIDIGTGLFNMLTGVSALIDKLGGLNTVLYVTVSILAVLNANMLKTSLFSLITAAPKLIAALVSKIRDFVIILPLLFNKAQWGATGVHTLKNALEALGVTASTTQIFVAGLAAAIGVAIAVHSAIKRKNEEQRQAAEEAASAYQETADSIDNYKNKIDELRKALDGGNLSEAEAYEKRKELLSIERELIDVHGDRARALNLVTGEINAQKDALDALAQAEWEAFERENYRAIHGKHGAVSEFTDGTHGIINVASPEAWRINSGINDLNLSLANKAFYDRFIAEINKAKIFAYELDPSVWMSSFSEGGLTAMLEEDNIYDALRAYEDLYDILKLVGEEFFGDKYNDYIGSALDDYSNAINEIKSTISQHETTFNTYAEGALQKNYSEFYSSLLAAQQQYDSAVLSGDDKAVGEAIIRMQELQALFDENSGSWGDEAAVLYVDNFFDTFMREVANRELVVDILLSIKGEKSGASDIADAFNLFKGEDGFVDYSSVEAFKNDSRYQFDAHPLTQAYNMLTAAAEEYGLSVLELYEHLVKYGLIQGELPQQANDVSSGLGAVKSAIAETKTELEEAQEIINKFSSDGISALNSEDLVTLINTFPQLRAELIDYARAVENGADSEARFTALTDDLNNAATNLKMDKMAEGMQDVVNAVDEYGNGSYQVEVAMLSLAQVAPNLVNALYNEESGMYDLGDSADSATAALTRLAGVEIVSGLVNQRTQIKALEGELVAMTDGANSLYLMKAAELSAARAEYKELEITLNDEVASYQKVFQDMMGKIGSGGGGGSSETIADKIKDSFDALSSSIEICIQKEEEYFENGKKNLDSEVMREALMQQVAYYQQIQREASTALEAVKEYYRGQGMSEGVIEQQSHVQDLTNDYLDATKDVRDAVDRMTSAIIDAFGEAIDSMQSVYDTLHKAADEYASSGYIAVDTLQEIISHGVEYLSLLQDENGQLTINEESIKKVIAARVEQMSVETALAYVEALRAANTAGNVTELNRLLYATQEVTGAQWDLVYATLALQGFDEEQNRAALHVIDSLRAMSESAQRSIFESADSATDALKQTREELEKMQSGVNDILEYTMDMMEHQIEKQIEAIEEQKEAFAEYIEMQKEALDNAKDETDYEEKKADILKKLADLQSNIDALSLVGTREADAEKAALLEEQAELQKELAELQGDHAIEAQKEALDKMQEAFEEEKDKEIEDAEASISSQQKLYDMAIDYIENNWDNLYKNLVDWNYEYGSVLEDEITSAWDSAMDAAEEYGDYLKALQKIQDDIDDIDEEINSSSGGSGGSTNDNFGFGETPSYDHTASDEAHIRAIVGEMKTISNTWHTASAEQKSELSARAYQLGTVELAKYGVKAVRGDDGVWYIDHVGGEQLYKVYHTGGIVGGGDIKSNEQFALLKKREWVLNENMVGNLTHQMSLMGKLGDFTSKLFSTSRLPIGNKIADLFTNNSQRLLSATNSRPIEISIGDTYISGMPGDTVKKHQAISKKFMDDLARQLGARW